MLAPSFADAACVGGAPDGTYDYRQGEACDTGGGPACSATCEVEPGWTCEGSNQFTPILNEDILHETYPGNDVNKVGPGGVIGTAWLYEDATSRYTEAPWGSTTHPDFIDPYEILQDYRPTSPAFAYSGLPAKGEEYKISAQGQKPDDGFLGFALGFQAGDTDPNTGTDAHYLLVDWKQGAAKSGDLEVADPDVALTGGRFLSRASTGTQTPSTGLGLLTLIVGLALVRRRRRARR